MPKQRTQHRIDQPYSPISANVVAVSGGVAIPTSILAGDGIDVNGNEVAVDATVVRTTRTLAAGDGLSGGGTLATDRTFAVDSTVVRTTRDLSAGDGLSGGGDLSADRSFAVDSTVVRTTRQVTAGLGLAGGGDLSADRDFAVGAGDGISVAADAVAVDASALVSGDYGLEVVSNDFRVKKATNSGLAFATGLALGTPGAVTATSSNAVTTSTHTHAATASADPGSAESLMKTTAAGSFVFGSDLLYIDNATKNIGINVTPSGNAALKVVSENNDDITVNIKQKSGQTARLWKVEDSSGQELIVLDSQGNLQSGNPGFVSGLTGWQISHIGNVEFNNAWIRGELHASIFVVDEFHSSGGTLVIAPAGKLENDMTLYTTTGTTDPLDIRTTAGFSTLDIRTTSGSFSGTTLSVRWLTNYFDITDPPAGHALVFSVGDVVRVKTLMMNGGVDLYDVWMRINSIHDQTDYYRYYVQWLSGGSDGLTIPAGAGIISYGQEGDGRILLTADQNYAPYIDVFNVGAEPWNGDITPRMRMGRIDGVGLPAVSGIEQYGIVAGTDLSDASAPYFVASNLGLSLYRVDIELNDGANPTVYLGNSGRVRFGTDVDNDATTGLQFDPNTGDLLVGQLAGEYVLWDQSAGTVTTNGAITITGGSGYANLSDIPTELADINTAEGAALNAGLDGSGNLITKVLPASAVGTPGGAGLYLGSDKMGYYSGSAWRTYMQNDGQFYFAGTGGAGIAWDLTDLYGTDGSTVQWYARASTGKLYAGGGNVILDEDGIALATSASGFDSRTDLTFTYGGNTIGSINAWAGFMEMYQRGIGRNSEIAIDAIIDDSSNDTAIAYLRAGRESGPEAEINARYDDDTGLRTIHLYADKLVTTGGDLLKIRTTAF